MQVIILAHICRIVHSMWLLKVWRGERKRERQRMAWFISIFTLHTFPHTNTRTQNDVSLKLCVLPNWKCTVCPCDLSGHLCSRCKYRFIHHLSQSFACILLSERSDPLVSPSLHFPLPFRSFVRWLHQNHFYGYCNLSTLFFIFHCFILDFAVIFLFINTLLLLLLLLLLSLLSLLLLLFVVVVVVAAIVDDGVEPRL